MVSKNFFFFLLFLIGKIRHGIGKKGLLFSIGNGAKIRPLEMGRKSPEGVEGESLQYTWCIANPRAERIFSGISRNSVDSSGIPSIITENKIRTLRINPFHRFR